jgi:membrane protease YdiL (CAAX protease family)
LAGALFAAAPTAAAAPAWLLIGAPLCEELVFRAGLQSWLARRAGVGAAVVASSLLFAAAHAAIAPTALGALTFFPSLVVGAVYAATGRLRHAVALHAAFNALWMFAGAHALRAMTT